MFSTDQRRKATGKDYRGRKIYSSPRLRQELPRPVLPVLQGILNGDRDA